MKVEKINAIKLRKLGKSYNEISKSLKIPKSTLSYWLRDIVLSKKGNNAAKVCLGCNYEELHNKKEMLLRGKVKRMKVWDYVMINPEIVEDAYNKVKW